MSFLPFIFFPYVSMAHLTIASFYHGTDSGGECGVMALAMLPQPQPGEFEYFMLLYFI